MSSNNTNTTGYDKPWQVYNGMIYLCMYITIIILVLNKKKDYKKWPNFIKQYVK